MQLQRTEIPARLQEKRGGFTREQQREIQEAKLKVQIALVALYVEERFPKELLDSADPKTILQKANELAEEWTSEEENGKGYSKAYADLITRATEATEVDQIEKVESEINFVRRLLKLAPLLPPPRLNALGMLEVSQDVAIRKALHRLQGLVEAEGTAPPPSRELQAVREKKKNSLAN